MRDLTYCPGRDEERDCPKRRECARAASLGDDDRRVTFFLRLPIVGADCTYFLKGA